MFKTREGIIMLNQLNQKKRAAKSITAVFLAVSLILSLFVGFSNPGDEYLAGYVVVNYRDASLNAPASLRDGEIWTGKRVVHNVDGGGNPDGTITVTLSAWGATYQACGICTDVFLAGETPVCLPAHSGSFVARPPLSHDDPIMRITDNLRFFRLRPDTVVGPGTLSEQGDSAVLWEVHQSHIIGNTPATISFTLELDLDKAGGDWETGYWYASGVANAVFAPCFLDPEYFPFANPFYYTNEETTFDTFTLSMNWNNGNGLNSGTITDAVFGESIAFGANRSPEYQSAYSPPRMNRLGVRNSVAHPVNNWAFNAYRPANRQMYYWHLEWEKGNHIKSYWFTVQNIDRGWSAIDNDYIDIDIVYQVDFPRPGGNNSSPAGRTRKSDDFFQRTFEPDTPAAGFTWVGNNIHVPMNIYGQLLLWEVLQVPADNTLIVGKELEGLWASGWNVNANTTYSAIVRCDGDRYMTFDRIAGTNRYQFTGLTSVADSASVLEFSVNAPAEITAISDGITVAVDEFFTDAIHRAVSEHIDVSYRIVCEHGGSCYAPCTDGSALSVGNIKPMRFGNSGGETHRVNVVNDYGHGVGFLEVYKTLDGFAADNGVDNNTVFHVMVWDVDYGNYLYFQSSPGPDGTYRCVGNDDGGLSEAYMGMPITALPISVNQPIRLSNLWTWGRYEIRAVVWDDETDEWVVVREKCSHDCEDIDCDWRYDDEWTWGVEYSEKNGVEPLRVGETQVVTVTSRYKRGVGRISIFKVLDGAYEGWGVHDNTIFHVRVSDDQPIVFDRVIRADGTYRAIGHFACDDPECQPLSSRTIAPHGVVHFSEAPASGNWNDILVEIPFSVNAPVLLSNLWTDSPLWQGDRRYYRIEEVGDDVYQAFYRLNGGLASSNPLTGVQIPVYIVDETAHVEVMNVYETFTEPPATTPSEPPTTPTSPSEPPSSPSEPPSSPSEPPPTSPSDAPSSPSEPPTSPSDAPTSPSDAPSSPTSPSEPPTSPSSPSDAPTSPTTPNTPNTPSTPPATPGSGNGNGNGSPRTGSGNLAVYHETNGFSDIWGVDDDTDFTAVVRTADGRYLVFEEISPNRYRYVGTTASRDNASRLNYSVNFPAVVIDIPNGTVVTVVQISNPSAPYAGYLKTSYRGNGTGVFIDDCTVITVTNVFRRGGADMLITKQLDGYYEDWGIDGDTIFYATVTDVLDNAQVVFTREADGSYRAHYGDLESGVEYFREIPFSVNNPAKVTNLRPGQVYIVEELGVPDCDVQYTYSDSRSIFYEVIITNTFPQPSEMYQVNYNANWPLGIPRDGIEPPSSTHYAGVDVSVHGNPGNLNVVDWVKIGWALDPISRQPDFWRPLNDGEPAVLGASYPSTPLSSITDVFGGDLARIDNTAFLMPARDVDLFGVWRPRPLVRDVTKTVNDQSYNAGDSVQYTIRFTLPLEAGFYEFVRISDSYPSDALTFAGVQSLEIGGAAIAPIPAPISTMSGGRGQVDVILTAEHLTNPNRSGEEVALTLNFTVNEGASGVIRNTARIYVKTAFDDEPDESDGSDAEIIVEDGRTAIIYNPNWPDGRQGSGTPPEDNTAYPTSGTAVIRGNEGELQKPGYEFTGWSLTPHARVPDLQIGSEIPMSQIRTLYGVWRLSVDVTKTPSAATYEIGDTVDFTIRFNVPCCMENYSSLRIEDVIPDGLVYTGRYELIIGIGDYNATGDVVVESTTRDGRAIRSVTISGDLLLFSEGRDVALTLSFLVTDDASGDIVNRANVYFTPTDSPEPEEPDSSGTGTITPADDGGNMGVVTEVPTQPQTPISETLPVSEAESPTPSTPVSADLTTPISSPQNTAASSDAALPNDRNPKMGMVGVMPLLIAWGVSGATMLAARKRKVNRAKPPKA
jgi:fimbrial isopeptide formation D2 family protein